VEVVVLPSLYEESWESGPVRVPVYRRLSMAEAFETDFPTDAMFATYLVAGDDRQPRLAHGALDALAAVGQPVNVHWAFIDYDCAGHKPWDADEDAVEAMAAAVEALPPEVADTVGCYTTRAGFRLVWWLGEAGISARVAGSFLRALAARMPEVPGVELDTSTTSWLRLFRVPRPRRDGRSLRPAAALLPEGALDAVRLMNLWDETFTAEAPRTGDDYDDDIPPPVQITLDDWAAAFAFPWLRQGRAFRPEGGHVYPVIRRVLASVAAAGDITDARTLLSLAWISLENTPDVDMPGVWRLCRWIATRQAEAKQRLEDAPTTPPPARKVEPEEWEAIRKYFTGHNKRIFDRLRDGLALSSTRSRLEEVTYTTVRLLAEKARVPSAELIYQMVLPSVEKQGHPGPTPEDVWNKTRDVLLETRGANDEVAKARVFCAEWPLTIKVVGQGGPLFQLDLTNSAEPVYRLTDQVTVYTHFDRLTRPYLPFEASYPTTMPLADIIRTYGASANGAVFVSGRRGTEYDSVQGRLLQGVHIIQDVQARYHDQIAEWLKRLGGDDPEGLLDWLAACPETRDQPIAALYIEGPGGIGKSLLANGIASLWGAPPVNYNQVTGNFNGGLLACPLLFADEGITVDRHNEGSASETFRNLVANTTHSLNPKFGALTSLIGAVRVLVTGNDAHAIPFTKALGQDGVDAIVERILKIKTDGRARDYLEQIGARNGALADWVGPACTPGRLAEHILWLSQTRILQREGKRFLVPGKRTGWHERFALDQGIKPAVLGVVRGVMKSPPARIGHNGMYVAVDNDERIVYINASTVYDHWVEHADIRRPKPQTVHDAVQQLATCSKQIRFKDSVRSCWGIPFRSFVFAHAAEWEDFGLVTPDPEIGGEPP